MKRQTIIKSGLLLLLVAYTGIANGQNNNQHELRIGVGAPFMLATYHSDDNYGYDPYLPGAGSSSYYKGDKIAIPSINLSYSYQFKTWLALGATLGYGGQSQKTYSLYTDAVHSDNRGHFIGITPTVRFDWLRTKTVKLYSCVGLGLAYDFEWESYPESGLKTRYEGFYMPTVDFTYIGISAGRKIFGFCELGISSHGVAKVGIGYRFNDKSKK